MKDKLIISIFCLFFFASCDKEHRSVERAFYYWKSDEWRLNDFEEKKISNLGVNRLFVKFFEVERNDLMGNIPISKTELSIYDKTFFEYIPCIYVHNNVFKKSSKKELQVLAENIYFLVNKKANEQFRDLERFKEIQIDCDWTQRTKENYFYFLKQMRFHFKEKISCTLRLYPFKYPNLMGVPPVDRAMLMCYNLLSPLQEKNKNSILDRKELSSYLTNKKYPLSLDIALPLYSSMQLYKNNHFETIFYKELGEIKKICKPIDPLWYEIQKDTVFGDVFFRVGDKIKYDEITKGIINESIEELIKKIPVDSTTTVSFFHLDYSTINKFSDEELSAFYNRFDK